MSQTALASLLVVGAVCIAAGAALLRLPAARPAGLLTLLTGVLVAGGVLLDVAPVGFAGEWAMVLAGALTAPLALTCYPSVSPRDRIDVLMIAMVGGAGGVVVLAEAGAVGGVAGRAAGWVLATVLLAHLWWKLERAGPAERRSLTWLALGLAAAGVVEFLVSFVAEGAGGAPMVAVAWLVLAVPPVAMVVGTRSPEIVDTRGLVVSGVVVGTAVLACVSLFVTAASVLEVVLGHRAQALGVEALLAAGCAAVFHPLQVMLHGVIDRLLFGERPDPLHAAARVAGEVGDDPEIAVATIREALVLPYVALRSDDDVVASSGTPTPHTREFVLPGTGTELVVGLRPGDLRLGDADRHVLGLTVPLLTQTMRARALNVVLRQTGARTRVALEEERRRVRRDLHDGLGPRLSGIAYTTDAATNLMRDDPEAARELLTTVRAEAAAAVEDLRRLVYGMRPPALDELGLVGAVLQQAGTLRSGGRGLEVTIDVHEGLPSLPAAVEVAAYRIVTESLTNVARHTSSPSATVSFEDHRDRLLVTVTDAATGVGAWTPGVGLSSMRERAQEIGGTFEAGWGPTGGRVAVTLPLSNS